MEALWLTEVFKAGVCAGMRNGGREDWAGSMQS